MGIQRHHQQPVCTADFFRQQLFGGTHVGPFNHIARLQTGKRSLSDRLRERFKGEFFVAGGDHRTVAVQQQTATGGRRLNAAHVGNHAVHGHIARDHGGQGAVLFNRYGEGHHQFTGSGIDIRRGYYRRIGFQYLLIPRADSGIVIRRHPGRIGEFRRLAGIAHIHIGETACVCDLRKDRNRIVSQRHALQRGHHHHLAVHPVGNRHTVAVAGAG